MNECGIATLAVVMGVLLGQILVIKWGISLAAMTLTAGIVFFLVTLRQLIKEYSAARGAVLNRLLPRP